ncbi:AMP-binding protein [Endozoicomonas montiporae]|uniref:AMP-dependent synthetase and ligase n=1 Tax=Endozoicomonas montiporae CL-33 TaxID=570277 RepID=A0A142B8B6_9GAMM|nr:AMP-binding protein [Endozoicomonas montiporae]AMO54992.1 AMP-dependent synthetase and ligase [Endozoicomonas montiporae CL-33]
MPFLSQLIGHPADSVAVIDETGEHTYGELIEQARILSAVLKQQIEAERPFIAFLAGRDALSVVSLLAIWLADGIAVPLDPMMPVPEWEWRIRDVDANYLIYAPGKEGDANYLMQRCGIAIIKATGHEAAPPNLITLDQQKEAVVIYTSGTSRYPRGVVHTFGSIEAQVKTLCQAWNWSPEDRLLHVLPIAHIHGLVCGLLCTLAAGASCELMPSFKTESVWEQLASRRFSLFTAVPAIYQYMLDSWSKSTEQQQGNWQRGASALRLAIVGSSPLPPSVHNQWQKLTGKPLLTRYGLTEAGMVLSQQEHGERRPECLGSPLPGVSVRLVDESGNEVNGVGELEVRSPQMFKGYHGKDDLNQRVFDHGWFRTGDMAMLDHEQYRLLGKRSIDIIKTGGYRVSALEIEAMLDAHPGIRECAILGTPCDRLGEAICACVVPLSRHIDLKEVREWLCMEVASYKLPTKMTLLEQLPRTPLGKIDKQGLKRELSSPSQTFLT